MIRQYRYFFLFLHAQEHYLNRMANKGYRLTHCGIASYEFEKTNQPVVYQIEYIADRSIASFHHYLSFLEELGYTYHLKNINVNYTAGRAKLRFTGHGLHMQTSRDMINHELLIIEHPKDTLVKPYTTFEDQLHYLTSLRNIYAQYAIASLLLTCYFLWNYNERIILLMIITTLAFLVSSIACIKAQQQIHLLNKEHVLYE